MRPSLGEPQEHFLIQLVSLKAVIFHDLFKNKSLDVLNSFSRGTVTYADMLKWSIIISLFIKCVFNS